MNSFRNLEMMADDILHTVILIATVVLAGFAYSVRVFFRGRARYDRVDRQGGSPLLSKSLMEMAYWSLQPLARVFVFLGISPNFLSWSSLFLGALAGVSFAYGRFGYGALLATYSAFLDSLDGIVARMTHRASDAGEVLDAAIDRYVEFFFLGGLIIYYRSLPLIQILAMLSLLGSFMVSYSTAKAEALHLNPPSGIMRRPERALYLILGAALSPLSINWFEGSGVSFPVAYPMVAAMGLVGILANVSSVERFWQIAQTIRERENQVKKESPPNHAPAEVLERQSWTLPVRSDLS